jgi:hypothetical protein
MPGKYCKSYPKPNSSTSEKNGNREMGYVCMYVRMENGKESEEKKKKKQFAASDEGQGRKKAKRQYRERVKGNFDGFQRFPIADALALRKDHCTDLMERTKETTKHVKLLFQS